MKPCIRCNETKPIEEFHRHKGMKDGRLNKCRACVQLSVAEWRKANPDCRAKEHARNAKRKGIKPRAQYLKDRAEAAAGSKARALKYFYKRKGRVKTSCELTEFAMEEMCALRPQRESATGFQWHIDHIIPLHHKEVSGLHVWTNLQLVPADWNVRKGNRNMESFW